MTGAAGSKRSLPEVRSMKGLGRLCSERKEASRGTTRSGVLGVVGALPAPSVLNGINAFTLGALAVNPRVSTRVVWINEWFNPPRETEAAKSLLNLGADVLMQTTDSPAALEQADRSAKHGFGLSSDMSRFAPKAPLGSIINNWAPYCTKAVRDVLDERWATGGLINAERPSETRLRLGHGAHAPRSSTFPARPTRSAAVMASAARSRPNTASTGSFSVPLAIRRASSPIMRASSAGGVAASRLLAQ